MQIRYTLQVIYKDNKFLTKKSVPNQIHGFLDFHFQFNPALFNLPILLSIIPVLTFYSVFASIINPNHKVQIAC